MFMMIDLDFVLPRYLVSLAKNEYLSCMSLPQRHCV